MSQYDDVVDKQRRMIAAEKWSKGIRAIHAHPLTSMWYETKPDRTGDDLSVIDTEYNDGLIEREYVKTGKSETIGTKLIGDKLLAEYDRHTR